MKKEHLKRHLTVLLAAFALSHGYAQSWELVWSDEFTGTELNTDYWNVEVRDDGCGNDELEYYTDRTDNVSVSGGNLVITARREDYGTKNFTSGRLNTKKRVYFTHGKVSARIKLPSLYKGLWPAFWMLGDEIDGEEPWPICGEIDIMEMGQSNGFSSQDDCSKYFGGCLHWGTSTNAHAQYGYMQNADYSIAGDGAFHTYTLLWEENTIKMYLDDEACSGSPYYEALISSGYDAWNYFHKPFHILFNLAIGGSFTGISSASGITALPAAGSTAEMLVDYVKVWQLSTEKNIVTDGSGPGGGSDVSAVSPAPVPTRPAANVVTVFSDVYGSAANLEGQNWNDTGDRTIVASTDEDDMVYKFATLLNGGLMFDAINVSAAGMTKLHIDIYSIQTSDYSISFSPISVGPKQTLKSLTLEPGWNSFDLSLTEFTDVDFTQVFQMGFFGGGSKTVYLDNIYFYKEDTGDSTAPVLASATATAVTTNSATLSLQATDNSGGLLTYTVKNGSTVLATKTGTSGTAVTVSLTGLSANTAYALTVVVADPSGNTVSGTVDFTTAKGSYVDSAPVPEPPAANVKSVYSDAYESATLSTPSWMNEDWRPLQTCEEVNLDTGDKAFRVTNYTFLAWEVSPSFATSGMDYVHYDIYPMADCDVSIHMNGENGSGYWVEQHLTANQWNQVDIALTEFTSFGKGTISQLKFTGAGGVNAGASTVIYVDNIYFWKDDPLTQTSVGADGVHKLSGSWSNSAFATLDAVQQATAYDLTAVSFGSAAVEATPVKVNCFFITTDGSRGFPNEVKKVGSGYQASRLVFNQLTANGAYTDDVNTAISPIDVTGTATYNRDFPKSGVYLTTVSPFEVVRTSPADIKAYYCSSKTTEGGVTRLVFTEETGNLRAGIPYLVYTSSGEIHLYTDGAATVSFSTTDKNLTGGAFKPTFTRINTTRDMNVYTLPGVTLPDELVFKHSVNTYVPPFRAYLLLDAAPEGKLNVLIDDTATGLRPLGDDALPALFNVYSIDGREVKAQTSTLFGLPGGVYIVNGKKVVVK